MEIIDSNNLLHFLASNKTASGSCDHSEYLEWNNGNEHFKSSLIKFGYVKANGNQAENFTYSETNSLIDLDFYPYYRCDIFQCKKCNTLFFHYTESINQKEEEKYRLIRRELINIDGIKPKHRIVIDYKGLEYVIYKNPDLTYEISISKDIAVGVDIFHQLTNEEQVNYLKNGISALNERMHDMDINYNKYKVISWR
ncbi:hypothetical protein [Flavobacterium pedocola]